MTEQGRRVSPTVFGGRILVINFWETACAPCVKELPSLTAFARRFRGEHVIVVAVGADADVRKYQAFVRAHRVGVETIRDPSRALSKSFGTYMFPETYIIQDGRVVRKVVGGIDWMSDDVASFMRSRLKVR